MRPPTQPGAPAAPGEKPPSRVPPRETAPEEGGEGTFALEDPFTTVAAPRLATSSDRIVRGLTFHGLARVDAAGRIEPELAVSWEMLRGGAEWVFHLRPATMFTNGRYLEARHVVASWEKLILAPDSANAWLLEAVEGYEEARAGEAPHVSGLILEEGLTLRVVLRWPVLNFPARLAHPALGISAFGEDEEGSGPYQVWGTPKPQLVVLRSNPEYFRGLPHLDEITFVRGEAAAKERLATGALEAAPAGPLEDGKSVPGARIFAHAVGRTYILGLNRSVTPFSRSELARKFLDSLDREALCRAVAGDACQVPRTLLEGTIERKKAQADSPPPGAPPGGLGRLDLIYPEGDRAAALLSEKLGGLVTKSGGRIVAHGVRPTDLAGALGRGEYHLFILPFLPSSPDPLLRLEEMVRWNRSVPSSLFSSLRQMGQEGDAARTSAGLATLDASLRGQGFLVPLAWVPRRLLVRNGICGLHPDPVGMLDWTRLWRSRRSGGQCD